VKDGILLSVKGPAGGFTITHNTLRTPLMKIFEKTEGLQTFTNCVLRMKECNSANPCPMHAPMEAIRRRLDFILMNTSIGDLLKEDKVDFINSIATYAGINSSSELNQPVKN
ncbi:MAG: RrF2 family transcriptional regulator, partial [Flavisolibacter sp.]